MIKATREDLIDEIPAWHHEPPLCAAERDSVKDEAGLEVSGGGDDRAAGPDRGEPPSLPREARPCGALDRLRDAAAHRQEAVVGAHDDVHALRREITPTN